jgi:hypothetical protein
MRTIPVRSYVLAQKPDDIGGQSSSSSFSQANESVG